MHFFIIPKLDSPPFHPTLCAANGQPNWMASSHDPRLCAPNGPPMAEPVDRNHSKAWFGFTKAHQVPQTCQCFSMGGGAIDPWHIPVLTESCQLRAANGRLLNAPVKMVGISQESQKNLGARIGAQFLRHWAEAFMISMQRVLVQSCMHFSMN